MSDRRFDTKANVFNNLGRLAQIEYAMEAVATAGTCIGIVTKDGVLLAAERRKIDRLLDETLYLEKIHKINDEVVCAIAGVIGDANVLLQEVRLISERHLKRYDQIMPLEQLVSSLGDIKQAYTQFGGKRPFGVSILYMGWDKHHGYQLYRSDPCGNFFGWKAICIGTNTEAIMSVLKNTYDEEDMTLKNAQELALKCLSTGYEPHRICPAKGMGAALGRLGIEAEHERNILLQQEINPRKMKENYAMAFLRYWGKETTDTMTLFTQI